MTTVLNPANSLTSLRVDASGALLTTSTPPVGAATETTLASINTDLGGPADAAATTDTGTFSITALIKRSLQNWTTLIARTPALGQAVMTGSSPVVIASNQSSIPVTVAAGTAAIGDVGLQVRANATGAMPVAKVLTTASTNATAVKASAGRVLGWHFTNTSAALRVVRFYNLAVAPTVGTSVPAYVVAIPAGQTVTAAFPFGVSHSTGISYSVTGAIADLDTTVTAANDVVGAIHYA